ncbi:MAG TPA: hypothetical protein VFC71_02295 [Candidatus Polarisedimenticolia bacterium]|nr:hypothetical protein [Candidatus Polarisedimenticolia bacterium]
MNMRRAGAVALATLLVAGCASGGGEATDPAPSATPATTATTATTATETSEPTPVPACPEGLPYNPGTYLWSAKDTQTVPLTITMTEGWKGCGLAFKELGEPGGVMMIGAWDVVNVYANPCHWRDSLMDPPVGPAIDDLATALEAQELTEAEPSAEVTIDGYAGKHVRVEVPVDLDTRDCDADQIPEFRFWDGPGGSDWYLGAGDAPGLIGEAWIMDVDGRRVVIQAASFLDAGEERRDEIHGIVESIDFLP